MQPLRTILAGCRCHHRRHALCCTCPLPASSITLEAATFAVIHQYNADIAGQPASLTKLMTAYAAYECVEERGRSWDDEVPIAADDVHAVADDETRMGLVPGETISRAPAGRVDGGFRQ